MTANDTKSVRFGAASIQAKLIAFALLAAMVPTITLTTIYYTQNKTLLQEKVSDALTNLANTVARESVLWLDLKRENLSKISGTMIPELFPQAIDGDESARNRIASYLELVSERLPSLKSTAVLDLDGNFVSGTSLDPWSMPWNWAEQDNPLPLGDPVFDPDRAGFEFTLGHVFKEGDDDTEMPSQPVMEPEPLYLVVTRIGVDLILDPFIAQAMASGESIYLIDQQGRVQARSGNAFVQLDEEIDEIRLADLSMGEISDFVHQDGTKVYGTMVALAGTPWLLVAERPTDVVDSEIQGLQKLTVSIGVVMLLLVSGLAYWFAHRLTMPLSRLTAGAMNVAGGDLDVELEVSGRDELSYLTRVFNNRVQRLNEGREEIDAVNRKLREQNRELQVLSSTDPLTGLYNRQHLNGKLRSLLRSSQATNQPFAVMMLDLDSFKQLNDRHGHLAGDQALKLIAEHMRETLRASDYAARFGGEEFVVLLPKVGPERAQELAERLRQAVEDTPLQLHDEEVHVTTSVGIAVFPTDGEDPDTLINRADEALYVAKSEGRNRCVTANTPKLKVVVAKD